MPRVPQRLSAGGWKRTLDCLGPESGTAVPCPLVTLLRTLG